MPHMPTSVVAPNLYDELEARLDDAESDAGSAVAAVGELVAAGANGSGDLLVGYVNAGNLVFGAVGDGVTDDRAAVQSAINAAASAGVSRVYLPPGTYNLGRNGSNSYSLDIGADSFVLFGSGKRKTTVRHPTGMPNASVAIIRANNRTNITFQDIEFDGNWGNAVTQIAAASNRTALPQATITVDSTADFPSSGSITVSCEEGPTTVTYTGKTATTFTGCTGGSGTLIEDNNVGAVDAITGINHSSQADPKNYGLFLRGCRNVTIERCSFVDIYGDAIWIGSEASAGSIGCVNTRIINCDIDVAARNGITFGAKCEDTRIIGTRITNVFSQAVDFEPQTDFSSCVDVTIESSLLGTWFVPENHPGFVALSIVGSVTVNPGPSSMARNIKVRDCTIIGPTIVQNATDVLFDGCTMRCDWAGQSTAPILCQMQMQNVRFRNCWVYDRTTNGGTANRGAVSIQQYAAGLQPGVVALDGCHIFGRNGRHGIVIEGTGGRGHGASYLAPITGTATSVTNTTLVDTGATWTVNQLAGWRVRVGSSIAMIRSNTATTLTLGDGAGFSATYAWTSPDGRLVATPSAGGYVIYQDTGIVSVTNTDIDCGDDGRGAGANGVWIHNELAGMRVVLSDVRVKNATGGAVHVKSSASADKKYRLLELRGIKAWDDQATPTCTAVVNFENSPNVASGRWIMADNIAVEGVAAVYTNLSSGTWLSHLGVAHSWEGYGSPEGVVTAPIGSTYRRLNGGSGTTLYVKESGAAATGWVAK